jgi:catechol 2,3-dioxygenase-like lactoylglutathione lyase family enzyme
MAAMLEHVNITVTDPDESAAMLCTLFDWKVRWRGPSQMGGMSVHVGTGENYIAVYSPEPGREQAFDKGFPLNHVGIVVDDLDGAEARVFAMGLLPFGHGNYEPGRRFYFFDRNGIEFEVVSYTA